MSLHERIKEARKRKGLTQTELGAMVGVAKTTIAGYEKLYEPSAAQLGAIADALDVDVTFLLQDEIMQRKEVYASPYEMEHLVKKYRALDPYGKEAVDGVLDVEYRRCDEERKAKNAKAFRDARESTQREEAAEIVPAVRKVIDLRHHRLKASAGAGYQLDDDMMDTWSVELNDLTRRADFCIDVDGDSMEPKYYSGDIILVRQQPTVDVGEIGLFTVGDKGYVKKQGEDHLISINPEREDIFPKEYETSFCRGKVIGILDPDWIVKK